MKYPSIKSLFGIFLLFNACLLSGNEVAVRAITLYDSIYMEAESGEVEAPMRTHADSTASGGYYVEVDSGFAHMTQLFLNN